MLTVHCNTAANDPQLGALFVVMKLEKSFRCQVFKYPCVCVCVKVFVRHCALVGVVVFSRLSFGF